MASYLPLSLSCVRSFIITIIISLVIAYMIEKISALHCVFLSIVSGAGTSWSERERGARSAGSARAAWAAGPARELPLPRPGRGGAGQLWLQHHHDRQGRLLTLSSWLSLWLTPPSTLFPSLDLYLYSPKYREARQLHGKEHRPNII
jgi:hypothetical protein